MKSKLATVKLIISIIIAVLPLQNIAQEIKESVARIHQIATFSNGKIERSMNLTSLAQLRRSNQGNWLNIKKNDDLYYNDILKLNKPIWLRVNIKNRFQNGYLSLLQNTNDSTLSEFYEPGRYKVIEDQNRPGSAAIELMRGIAIFNIFKDAITTITEGLISSIESGSTTRALYRVNDNGFGEIYLQQGHLEFPGNTEVTGLQANQAAYFQNGKIIKVFFPNVPLKNEYDRLIKLNKSIVWKKPFLKRPGTWIGAAAIGISTALIIIKPWSSDEVSGTIKVNWGSN